MNGIEWVQQVTSKKQNTFPSEIFFSKETSVAWDQNPLYNEAYIKAVINQCDDILQMRGYLTYSELKEHLGIKPHYRDIAFGILKNSSLNDQCEIRYNNDDSITLSFHCNTIL